MKRQISVLACMLVLLAIVFAVASCTRPEAAHVHDYVQTVTKEATCTEKGEVTNTCSCGDSYIDETAALGHDIQKIEAKAPTCTESGLTEGEGCKNCGFVTVEQSVIAALGHEIGAAATCTTPQTCAHEGCDVVFVEALGHKANEPTCTEASVCSVCEVELKAALGHTEVEATCTEAAYCSVCNEELAPANGHSLERGMECYATWCFVCGMEWVEATKEHEFLNECDQSCMNCYEFVRFEATHDMNHIEAKDPTCSELGNIEYWQCNHCGMCWDNPQAMYAPFPVMRTIIPMVDHEYTNPCDAWCCNCYELTNEEAAHSLVHVDAVDSTCTELGNIEYWTCEYCGGCWDNDQATGMPLNRFMVIVPELGHTYTYECDAWCARCYELTNEQAAHSLSHVARVEATCTENGNVEYWTCEHCHGCWDNDQAMYMPLNMMMIVIPAPGHTYAFDCDPVCQVCYDINTEAEHDVVHVAAKAATCTADGCVEHWYCTYCNLCWVDEALTLNTNRNNVVKPNLGGHEGHEYDRKCDKCNLYVLPEEGQASKLGMYHGKLGKTLYLDGEMNGYYYATVENKYATPDFYVEMANGGFHIYFMKGATKTYLYVEAAVSNGKNYNNVKYGATKGLFTLDEKTGALLTSTTNGALYLGTYGDNTTGSASYTSYITGSNASAIDVSQYLLRFEVLIPHECDGSEPTCEAAGTACSVCGIAAAALGHSYVDGECENCGEEEPTDGPVAYYFVSTVNGTKYYFAGSVSGGVGKMTTDVTKAALVYKEEVNGGYYLYILDGTTQKYIYITGTSSKNFGLGSTKQVLKDITVGGVTTIGNGTRAFSLYNKAEFRTYAASTANNFNGSNGYGVTLEEVK